MFLAFREIRRAKVRFGLLAGAIGLLFFLILVQQTLQNGLLGAFTGAIEHQSAPVLVYSVDGQRTLQGSVVTPPLRAAVESVDEVGRSGAIGQGTFSVSADGDTTSAVVLGYEDPALGAPTTLTEGRLPARDGEAVASTELGDDFGLGARVRIEPGSYELTVVGRASDVSLFAVPTLFATYGSYEAAVRSANPDVQTILPNALGVEPAPGVSDEALVDAVNAASPEADALTRDDAARLAPGVSQVRTSFLLIFLLYGSVVPLVTGLFFLIVTLQKAAALTLLRAIGAPARRLVASLLVQVAVVMAFALVVGVVLYAPLSQATVGSIPLRFETGAVVFWSVALVVLGLVSASFAARRVLAIDPVAATTGAGVGR